MDRFKGKTILLVDDDGLFQTMFQVAMSKEGAAVIIAENGELGLKIALSEHPDLLVLDIVMPGMSGLEMLKKLREDPWGKDARVVISTSLQDRDKIKDAVNLGAIEYFIKAARSVDEMAEQLYEIFIKKS